MKIVCDNCKANITIPEGNIPKGRKVNLTCPKCKYRITIEPEKDKSGKKVPLVSEVKSAKEPDTLGDGFLELLSSDTSFSGLMESGQPTCLICVSDPKLKRKYENIVLKLGYQPLEGVDLPDALKKMREWVYDMIIVDENFDDIETGENGVLIYIERLEMVVRRKMFVVVVSKRYNTMDTMAQFLMSADLLLNPSQEIDLIPLIRYAQKEKQQFYTTLKESFSAIGRPFKV